MSSAETEAGAGAGESRGHRRAGRRTRLVPSSLLGRALLIIVTPLVVVQIVSAYVFFERHWGDVGRRLALGVAGDIAFLIAALEELPEGDARTWVFRRAAYDKQVFARVLPDAELPEVPEASTFSPLDRMLEKTLRERIFRPFRFDARSDPERVTVWVEIPEGVLTATVPVKRLFSTSIWVFILWMVGTSMILLAVAIYFLTRQVRPVRRLAAAAESFGKGVMDRDLKPEGAAEVRQAARAFLEMRERIRRQITQRTEMLAGVSHDLRTPLTRMKLEVAMLGDGETTENLRADITEMERMLAEYLDFARGEGGEAAAETDLVAVVREVADAAVRNGAAISVTADGAATLSVRPNAVKRALVNLVENAVRYGTHVAVSAGREGRNFVVIVDDDGPGIPEAERESVFKPFFRLDRSRNLDAGGVGLGLTIARDIARSHGGDVTLATAPTGGLRATFRLPA